MSASTPPMTGTPQLRPFDIETTEIPSWPIHTIEHAEHYQRELDDLMARAQGLSDRLAAFYLGFG